MSRASARSRTPAARCSAQARPDSRACIPPSSFRRSRSRASSPTPIFFGERALAGRRFRGRCRPGGADLRLDQRLCPRARRSRGDIVLRLGSGRACLRAGRLRRRVPGEEPHRSPVLGLVPVQRVQPDRSAGRSVAGARGRLGGGLRHPRPPREASRPRPLAAQRGRATRLVEGRATWAPAARLRRPRLACELLRAGRAPPRSSLRRAGADLGDRGVRSSAGRPRRERSRRSSAARAGDRRRPSWMAFAGTWGEDGYVHFPGNEPILAGAGPRGPAFHEQWRRPVAEVLSWPRG